MPILKKFKGMVKSEYNEKYAEELKGLSPVDFEALASTSPGMSNVYVLAEKKRREEEEKKKKEEKK